MASPVKGATSNAVTKPEPYHHGKLREGLLDAADWLLDHSGLPGLTLRQVAKRAGVSHAAPYHHFANLDDMLAALATRGFDRLSDALAKASGALAGRERLEAIAQAYVETALAHPSRFRLMFGPLLLRKSEFPGLALSAGRSFQALKHASLAYDPSEGNELALLGWSLVHGLANLLIDGLLDEPSGVTPDAGTLARRLTARMLAMSKRPA